MQAGGIGDGIPNRLMPQQTPVVGLSFEGFEQTCLFVVRACFPPFLFTVKLVAVVAIRNESFDFYRRYNNTRTVSYVVQLLLLRLEMDQSDFSRHYNNNTRMVSYVVQLRLVAAVRNESSGCLLWRCPKMDQHVPRGE